MSNIQFSYLIAGTIAGLIAVLLGRILPGLSDTLASVLISGVLAARYQTPWALTAVLLLGFGAPFAGTEPRKRMLLAGGLAVGAASTVRGPSAAHLLVGASILVLAPLAKQPIPSRWGHVAQCAGISACLAAIALGGPDTEATFALAGAILVVTAVPALVGGLGGTTVSITTIALVAWISVDAFRGRPAGLVAVPSALACAWLGLRCAQDHPFRRPMAVLAASGATGVVALASSRTVGLRSTVSMPAAAVAGACLCAALLGAWSARQRPATSRP